MAAHSSSCCALLAYKSSNSFYSHSFSMWRLYHDVDVSPHAVNSLQLSRLWEVVLFFFYSGNKTCYKQQETAGSSRFLNECFLQFLLCSVQHKENDLITSWTACLTIGSHLMKTYFETGQSRGNLTYLNINIFLLFYCLCCFSSYALDKVYSELMFLFLFFSRNNAWENKSVPY